MFKFFKEKTLYKRDYVIGSICSMIEQMQDIDLESFTNGKLVISNKVKSIGWIGAPSGPKDGYDILLDLTKLPSAEKTLIDLMLQRVTEAQGMAKIVATDIVATALHKFLKRDSEKYARMSYDDPRLR